MTEEPPRLRHNRELAEAYLSHSGIVSRYPKVSEQLETVPLETGKLFQHGYNPSIADHGGELVMAYRYHADDTLSTKLALATLEESGAVKSNRTLALNGKSVEDPKLHTMNGALWMSYVESTWPDVPPNAVVKHGVFINGEVGAMVQPSIGKNDWTAIEKNWVFFSHKDVLFCIYQCSPVHEIWSLNEIHSGLPPLVTAAPAWPYGPIRGGTPPIEYEGKLLRFFHSALYNELTPDRWRYYAGCYLMEPEPPFAVVRVSKRPILYGSEIDDLTPKERQSVKPWKSKIVFPGGAVARDGYWLVSVGCNDSACCLVKVTPDALQL